MLNNLGNNIYAIEESTSEAVAKMFIRLQENYESPKFRNKIFTLDEFKEFYKSIHPKNKFTYYKDWAGFNVPGHIVKRFIDGKFNPLTKEEKKLLKKIKDIKGKFYLIGYAGSSLSTKKHEIAHGMFYTNPEYRREVMKELENFSLTNDPVIRHMRDMGYHEAVVVDEMHAWVLTDKSELKKYGLWRPMIQVLSKHLNVIYKRYRNAN